MDRSMARTELIEKVKRAQNRLDAAIASMNWVPPANEQIPIEKRENNMGDQEETVTETTVTESVPAHEVVREEHRVSGEPDHVIKETTTVETSSDD